MSHWSSWWFGAPLLATLVMLAAAMRWSFNRTAGVFPRMRLLAATGTISALLVIATVFRAGVLQARMGAAGMAMLVASQIVFWSAHRATRRRPLALAFTPAAPDALLEQGIYAIVRHPFYLSYTLTWLSAVVATGAAPMTVVATIVMCTQYLIAAHGEERGFARSSMRDQYADYCGRTGMFWPRLVIRAQSRSSNRSAKTYDHI